MRDVVSRGSSELVDSRAFDMDIMQYGIMPQQLARARYFYPEDHSRLMKTPVSTAEKNIIVQGSISEISHHRCLVRVHDITLGPSAGVVEKRRHAEAVPDALDPESFPGQFASPAEDVLTFLDCLKSFPEFTEEAVNRSLRAFEVDLKVNSSVGYVVLR
jgi:hypothetical protein